MDTTLSSLLILGNLKVGGEILCDGRVVYTSKTLGTATNTMQGLMSVADKQKLDTITPGANANRAISDSINSASSSVDASSKAVKTAYDRAVLAETNAATYTDTRFNAMVNGAAASLDTLKELADALNNDASFATNVTNSIATKVSKAGDTMTGNLIVKKTDSTFTVSNNTQEIRLHVIAGVPTLDVVDGSIRNVMKWNLTDKIPELQEGARIKGKSQITNSDNSHGYQWLINGAGELVLSKFI